jgi:hypothetical protein
LSSLFGSMLGQHPGLFALPATNLLSFDSVRQWWTDCLGAHDKAHGLLQAVAQVVFGEQSEEAMTASAGWLQRRLPETTGAVLEALAERVHPSIVVDTSTRIVFSIESMKRALEMFPQARFVHLLRHPRWFCEAVQAALLEEKEHGRQPAWLVQLATFPPPSADGEAVLSPEGEGDPEWAWYTLNRNIVKFLAKVPLRQVFRLRVEEVLSDPNKSLRSLVSWLKLPHNEDVLDAMKHPERCPFACREAQAASTPDETLALDGSLSWRKGSGFAPLVRQLAEDFGYT